MSQLIAMVATAVIVNGERVVIQPGDPLPELSDHDSEQLKKAQAALDPQLHSAAREVATNAAMRAAAQFEHERQRVISEAASIAKPASEGPTAKPTPSTPQEPLPPPHVQIQQEPATPSPSPAPAPQEPASPPPAPAPQEPASPPPAPAPADAAQKPAAASGKKR